MSYEGRYEIRRMEEQIRACARTTETNKHRSTSSLEGTFGI